MKIPTVGELLVAWEADCLDLERLREENAVLRGRVEELTEAAGGASQALHEARVEIARLREEAGHD